jgi:hypothetical protein|tara:strand:+ start:116 stop:352 length:237 start_codon:yes stop_codon:yes gene_type:complete
LTTDNRAEFRDWIEQNVSFFGYPPYPGRLEQMRRVKGISESDVEEMIKTAYVKFPRAKILADITPIELIVHGQENRKQ